MFIVRCDFHWWVNMHTYSPKMRLPMWMVSVTRYIFPLCFLSKLKKIVQYMIVCDLLAICIWVYFICALEHNWSFHSRRKYGDRIPPKNEQHTESAVHSGCKNDVKETWKNLYANWWFAFCMCVCECECVCPSASVAHFFLHFYSSIVSFTIKLLLFSFSSNIVFPISELVGKQISWLIMLPKKNDCKLFSSVGIIKKKSKAPIITTTKQMNWKSLLKIVEAQTILII